LSRAFDSSLTVPLRASAWCGRILLWLHAGAALCVSVAQIPWTARLVLGLALAASLWRSLRLHATRRHPRSVSALRLEADGELSVRFGAGGAWQACRIDRCVVYAGAVLLRLRREGARLPFSVLVAADAVEPATFRRLRARLRLGSAAAREPCPGQPGADRAADSRA
jgi:hypothetical protein